MVEAINKVTGNSQHNEEAYLTVILDTLGIEKGLFCEFGAWDGIFLSNCAHLVKQGWEGVFIEGDEARFRALSRNYAGNDATVCLNAFVSRSGAHSLPSLLGQAGKASPDLISIDIDSDDLGIWMSSSELRPSVVLIEFNPTIPFDTEYINPEGSQHGSSARSILHYAESVGYELVAATLTNLFFVSRDSNRGRLPIVSLEQVYETTRGKARFAFGYDGTLLCVFDDQPRVQETIRVPWSGYMAVQPVPRSLRGIGRQTKLQGAWSLAKALTTRPYVWAEVRDKMRRH